MTLLSYQSPPPVQTNLNNSIAAGATKILVSECEGLVAGESITIGYGQPNAETVAISGGYVASTGRNIITVGAVANPHFPGETISHL